VMKQSVGAWYGGTGTEEHDEEKERDEPLPHGEIIPGLTLRRMGQGRDPQAPLVETQPAGGRIRDPRQHRSASGKTFRSTLRFDQPGMRSRPHPDRGLQADPNGPFGSRSGNRSHPPQPG
jgi:hypothetical protein